MPKIKVRDIDIFYSTCGEGEPLILLAGLGSDHTFWTPIIEPLSKRFQTILIDNRGVGQSDSPDTEYTTLLMAEDIIGCMDALDLPKAHIMGHSIGGMISQHMAISFPDRVESLVLYSSFAKMSPRSLLPMKFNGELFTRGIEPALVLRNVVMWIHSNELLSSEDSITAAVKAMMESPHPQSPVGFMRQLTACEHHDTRGLLEKIHAPTLIISGEDDIMSTRINADTLTSGIPGSRLIVIPEMGHCSHLERPELFLEALMPFFN